MIDPIKTAYIAGFMAKAHWDDDEERVYWENEAENYYKDDIECNWYGLREASDRAAQAFRVAEAAAKYVDSNEKAYASAPPETLDKLHDIITPLWPDGDALYDRIITELHFYARDIDPYENGLPLGGAEEHMVKMREIVREILEKR
jgi:hypothetical protein